MRVRISRKFQKHWAIGRAGGAVQSTLRMPISDKVWIALRHDQLSQTGPSDLPHIGVQRNPAEPSDQFLFSLLTRLSDN
ncbi:hypothetical protein TWF788_007327 [Orbilia oligospora]|uniref:Uncharacterized protein n=1 Tax=Orbilia oligospora TaxID=2813651 RepID=A0A7C8Q3M9_ORBOL|nr:hypothetical protein TWF788_007327 [Orbilia oligospora]